MKWTKMSGAGNSFWITHCMNSPQQIEQTDWEKVAQTLCYKNNTVQTDGLVVLIPSKTCDFKWLFYNSDGSLAEMCGNAACCVVDYAFKKQLTKAHDSYITFETLSQKITGELQEGKARIFLKQSPFINHTFKITFNNKIFSYKFIDSGVPHAVIELKKWSDLTQNEEYKTLAQYLRKQTQHHLNGMNISFYCSQEQKNQVHGISFERGLEDFTLACGTGALAIATVYHQSHPSLSTIFVYMPGGQLQVGLHSDKKISLMSPVKWLQEIEK